MSDNPVPGVALARALAVVAPQQMWPVRGVHEVTDHEFAARLLAALSPADKLAIAGITKRVLEDAWADHWLDISRGPRPLRFFHNCGPSCAAAILAALGEQEQES